MKLIKNLASVAILVLGLIGLLAKHGDTLFGNPKDDQVPAT